MNVPTLRGVESRLPGKVRSRSKSAPYVTAALGIGLAASALAVVNRQLSKRAERRNPLRRFVNAGALRVHYYEAGRGEAVVLLHGNGSMIEDFEIQRPR